MSGHLSREEKAKRWRPWRFSLRFLMLLTLVVAAFFGGWAANDWNRQRAMKAAPPVQPIVVNGILKLPADQTLRMPLGGLGQALINDLPK